MLKRYERTLPRKTNKIPDWVYVVGWIAWMAAGMVIFWKVQEFVK